jgi:PAS domain S-box-containing protein
MNPETAASFEPVHPDAHGEAATAPNAQPGQPSGQEAHASTNGKLASHVVQFYRDDSSLVGTVSAQARAALARGDAAVIIGSSAHREAIVNDINLRDPAAAQAVEVGRLVSLDAGETLSQILVDGAVDAFHFALKIVAIIERARAAATSEPQHVVIFGEMVALLCAQGRYSEAIRLERLWNFVLRDRGYSLLCAYPLSQFSSSEYTDAFLKICGQHLRVIPEESYRENAGDEERRRGIAALQQKLAVLEHQSHHCESDHQLHLFVEAVQDYAIFMLDPQGRIQTWNVGAERIKGYRASEIIGRHYSCFYPSEDVHDGKPQRLLEIAAREGRVEDEGWRVRKDGTTFWANVTITAYRDATGKVIGYGKVTRDFTERMLTQRALIDSEQKLRESEQSLRQLSRHLLRTQDEERRRIGRDLHDTLGQLLSVLKMKLDSLLIKPERNQTVDRELQQCAKLIEDSVKEVRTISYLLYPPMLEEMGLRSAIPWYLDGFMKRSGIKITFKVPPEFNRLPAEIELALFRVLQESLTNVHRHSGSPTAHVELMVHNGAAVLEISDQGKGMSAPAFEKSCQDMVGLLGVGLRGMCERMRQLGGTLDFTSSTAGTMVTATIAIPDHREAEPESTAAVRAADSASPSPAQERQATTATARLNASA